MYYQYNQNEIITRGAHTRVDIITKVDCITREYRVARVDAREAL
jgi:hypothetical protein